MIAYRLCITIYIHVGVIEILLILMSFGDEVSMVHKSWFVTP